MTHTRHINQLWIESVKSRKYSFEHGGRTQEDCRHVSLVCRVAELGIGPFCFRHRADEVVARHHTQVRTTWHRGTLVRLPDNIHIIYFILGNKSNDWLSIIPWCSTAARKPLPTRRWLLPGAADTVMRQRAAQQRSMRWMWPPSPSS